MRDRNSWFLPRNLKGYSPQPIAPLGCSRYIKFIHQRRAAMNVASVVSRLLPVTATRRRCVRAHRRVTHVKYPTVKPKVPLRLCPRIWTTTTCWAWRGPGPSAPVHCPAPTQPLTGRATSHWSCRWRTWSFTRCTCGVSRATVQVTQQGQVRTHRHSSNSRHHPSNLYV